MYRLLINSRNDSKFLFNSIYVVDRERYAFFESLKATKMTKLENALIWLYLKTWGKFGDHVINEKYLWNFSGNDLETVIMSIAFPRKKEKTERAEALTDLIIEKFEHDGLPKFTPRLLKLFRKLSDLMLLTDKCRFISDNHQH